jgi:hypothetical protein
MGTAKHKNSGLRRTKATLGLGELAAGVALLSAFIIAIVLLSTQPMPQAVSPPDFYTGSIVIFSGENAKCRRLTFDNVTGAITDEGKGDCSTRDGGRTRVLSEIANSFRGK